MTLCEVYSYPQRIWRCLQCDDAPRDERLFCDGLARDGLVGIGFSYDAGFHVAGYFRRPRLVPGMISKRGSKSTIVDAS